MPDDFEWRLFAHAPELEARGREAVQDLFERIVVEFPDWRWEPQEFMQGDTTTILVRGIARATGRQSGFATEHEYTQVWDLDDEGRPVRVREYERHEDALEAAAGDKG